MREDALLTLKEAEERRSKMIEKAKQEGEEHLGRTKREVSLKLEKGRTEAEELQTTLLAARVEKFREEARLVRERGVKNAERVKSMAEQNKTEIVNRLIERFERDLDA